MDELLLPFYADDLAKGRITPDGAGDLIEDFYCKNNLILGRGEHQMGRDRRAERIARRYDRSVDRPRLHPQLWGGPLAGHVGHFPFEELARGRELLPVQPALYAPVGTEHAI